MWCGATHNQPASNLKRGKGKFCSASCARKYKTEHNTKKLTCSHCKLEFILKNSAAARTNRKQGIFCSKTCMDTSRYRRKDYVCKKCGKIFSVNIGSQNKNIFCSRDCYIKDGGKRTSIEIFVEEIINEQKIEYETQKSIKNKELWTYVDFFFQPKICLYVDGDYWHSLPENAKRDKYNNETLPKYNYIVIRIKESEIKKGKAFILPYFEEIKRIKSSKESPPLGQPPDTISSPFS